MRVFETSETSFFLILYRNNSIIYIAVTFDITAFKRVFVRERKI